jgi:hypothetical protein
MYLPWQIFRRGSADPTAIKQDVCTCRQGFQECPVWRSVVKRLSEQVGYDIYADPFRFRVALLAHQRYTRSPSSLLRAARAAFRATTGIGPLNALWYRACRRAVANNWLLFDAICATQNVSVVVDSSKDPLRLRLLHQQRPDDVRVLLLVRDPRGVAWSAKKRNREPVGGARAWHDYYARAMRVLRTMPKLRLLRVQYEELCRDPAGMRRRIAAFLDLSDPGPTLDPATSAPHMIAGNPTRYRWNGEIRMDEAWQHEFVGPAREQVDALHARLGPRWPQVEFAR